MSSPFSQPAAPSSGIQWGDIHGALVLVEPLSIETDIETSYGKSEAVRADVTVLDGPHAGTEYPDTLIFPKVLAGQLRRSIGQKVLGRVTQGQAKPGQSPPWMLAEASPEDQQLGVNYLNQRQAGQVAQPAAANEQPAPQQQPVQGQQPQQQWPQPQQPQQGQQQGGQVPF